MSIEMLPKEGGSFILNRLHLCPEITERNTDDLLFVSLDSRNYMLSTTVTGGYLREYVLLPWVRGMHSRFLLKEDSAEALNLASIFGYCIKTSSRFRTICFNYDGDVVPELRLYE